MLDLPPVRDDMLRTIERPVVLAGRVYDPARADEAVVTQQFADTYDVGVGTTQYADNLWGSGEYAPANALVRLRDGAADLPRLRADLAEQSGYPDVVDLGDRYDRVRHSAGFEAAWMLGFAGAALVAAMVLVGQWIARYVAADGDGLRAAGALGLGPGQAVGAAAVGPGLAAVVGLAVAVGTSIVASRWLPIGTAADLEPSPGIDIDLPVLATVTVLALTLLLGWTCVVARLPLTASAERPSRPSTIVGVVRRTAAAPAVQLGTRFALERGRGPSSVPVLPGMVGAVVGVAGVVGVLVFGAGLSEALDNPARFGQTWQAGIVAGYNGVEVLPARQLESDLRALPYVEHVTDTLTGAVTTPAGTGSVVLWSIDTSHDAVDTVLSAGRMPRTADEVTLAPTTADQLHLSVGSRVLLAGSRSSRTLTVVGIGFVPTSVETQYHEGGWITPSAYDSLFAVPGLHQVLVEVGPDARDPDVVGRIVTDLGSARPHTYAVTLAAAPAYRAGRLPVTTILRAE
ncbi:hypothetical protein GCM10022242_38490 [Nocardioides panacisoli]|uniref:MacB-like periplasmic core domain-containing protein n=1 Tax=Nocardioides panacisoli TaxID=627624 RepID=A0ABP7J4D0_9ACTN